MKTKVFIIIDHLGEGGAQRQVVEYLKYADRAAFDIEVITLSQSRNIVSNEIKNLGYEIVTVDHKGFCNPSTLLRLRRLFAQEKPDIVHTFLFTADLYGRLAARLAGVKHVICSIRNVDYWKRWHHILADRILAQITDAFTLNAKSILSYVRDVEKLNPDKMTVIYNGVDLKRFANLKNPSEVRKEMGIPTGDLVVGMVGRFSSQKDYETFFATVSLAHEKKDNISFVVVGDGPLRNSLQSIVHSQQLEDKIHFLGSRNDIPDILSMIDVCVLSSHYEGCPNVILEYMACSKPVIASNVGGCAELVVEGETGFIVPSQDAPALAERIDRLLADSCLRNSMGDRGRKRVEDYFTAEVMAKKTENLYRKLLQPKIAYILSQFPKTSETFIMREIDAMKARGIDIKLLSLKPCKDKIIHQEAKELMPHTIYGHLDLFSAVGYALRHPIKTAQSFLYVLRTYWQSPGDIVKAFYVWMECFYFIRTIKKFKIIHIHSHWATMPTTAAVILSRLTGASFSFTAHAWDIFMDNAGLKEKIDMAKMVVTCTGYNRDFLSSVCEGSQSKKIYSNYHGIDTYRFPLTKLSHGNKKLRILSIGRLVDTKGLSYLIDACSILKNSGLEFECMIVGEGGLRDSLSAMVNEKALERYVKFLGVKGQEEIKKLYAEATVLVQPSVITVNGDRDGIPNVIIEAMATGLPVIATEISGIPEIIIDRETGMLVPEQESLVLSEAIATVWKDMTLREKLSKNGRRVIEEKFNIDTNIEELITIFKQNCILDGRKYA